MSSVYRIMISFSFVRKFSTQRNKIRRVVVTGLGVVSPLGCQVKIAFDNVLKGNCGIISLGDQYDHLPCRIGARISTEGANKLLLDKLLSPNNLKTMSPATALALVAADEALKDSNWEPTEKDSLNKTGVAIGTGMIDIEDVCNTNELFKQGYKKVSPYFIPRILPNMTAGQISIKYGFRGPNHSVSTACATGCHSIGDSFRFIQARDADVMVCGGAESSINPLAIAGFCRLRALSTSYNDSPAKASRPFDKKREGFVMGEGAAVLILEELEHALNRSAKIYGEILGYGLSGDASHITAPREDGTGALLSMHRAMEEANISKNDVGYINAHATSTPIGDAVESKAISGLFGDQCDKLAISSTKGSHGHLLGAAGNLESVFTILACMTGDIPPTINLNDPIDSLNYVPNIKQTWSVNGRSRRVALKNSFGFGGTNATLCIGQFV